MRTAGVGAGAGGRAGTSAAVGRPVGVAEVVASVAGAAGVGLGAAVASVRGELDALVAAVDGAGGVAWRRFHAPVATNAAANAIASSAMAAA
jgi:hypothetical protein